MAMQDYLKSTQSDSKKSQKDTPDNMKGGNELDFLKETDTSISNQPVEDVKGHNNNASDSDTTSEYNPPGEIIEQQIYEMFKETAMRNKCFVPLNKLTPYILVVDQPSKCPPPIDPYSSLEDIGDSHSETQDTCTNQTTEEPWKE